MPTSAPSAWEPAGSSAGTVGVCGAEVRRYETHGRRRESRAGRHERNCARRERCGALQGRGGSARRRVRSSLTALGERAGDRQDPPLGGGGVPRRRARISGAVVPTRAELQRIGGRPPVAGDLTATATTGGRRGCERAYESRGRRSAVRDTAHGGIEPDEDLYQARRSLSLRARPPARHEVVPNRMQFLAKPRGFHASPRGARAQRLAMTGLEGRCGGQGGGTRLQSAVEL